MPLWAANLAWPTITHPTRYRAPGSRCGTCPVPAPVRAPGRDSARCADPHRDPTVPREVDSGPPLRQAWADLEIPFFCAVNSCLRFFSQALNFVTGFGFPPGVPTDVRGRKTGGRVSQRSHTCLFPILGSRHDVCRFGGTLWMGRIPGRQADWGRVATDDPRDTFGGCGRWVQPHRPVHEESPLG